MKTWQVDINCDVGEGIGNESDVFPYISSCNIACGGHAGDVQSMWEVILLAQKYRVKIGAHPSYPDKANFGREVMDIPADVLIQSIKNQLGTFYGVLKKEDAQLHHIKAHGALYNQTARDVGAADVYLEAIKEYRDTAIVYAPFGSVAANRAESMGFEVWHEAFADRNYNPDLSLVSRKSDKALIEDPKKVLDHILPIIKKGTVATVDGKTRKIEVKTLCVHGDTPSALEILMYLSRELPKHQVNLEK
ncbi:5-oxoprolinase subunit PxpA [Flagellimonas taeanensis]|uniref:5-oxoprolinase subunit PxpA n=1 Tax=Flavobacteriaceae TaxID=49546 RepID=UPI000E69C283|nr:MULTISPECIES: 5-oxoprolinase subunit PxpA [Allomuricauda]MDC6386378.1 5-oxoprolinase subunit PxpA [Muricauda sp. SK9]RIV47949.1 5-oxoprolinase subunit PxpA [Allomuricauda taeanensis]